jgi:uncharacterized membrane protein YkoI
MKRSNLLPAMSISALLTAFVLSGDVTAGQNGTLAKQSQSHTVGGQTQDEDTNETNEANDQDPQLACSIAVPDPEPSNLASLATILPEDATVKALAGQPAGTTVLLTELGNENGCLVYEVELSNHLEVKVDAGNGAVLHVEAGDADGEEHDGGEVESEG